jgi:hypothetical protein
LLARNGLSCRIERLVQRHEQVEVYNITVEGLHCYSVGDVGVLVHNKAQQAYRPTKKPKDAPRGTKAIDKHPDTKDRVHELKDRMEEDGVGPASYVGISPDGDVIVSNLDGTAENLGSWKGYAN